MITRRLSLLLFPLLLIFAGCAPPMQPPMQPFNAQASPRQGPNYETKIDNFEIIIDTSLSMDENARNFLAARDIVRRINEGIPANLNYTAGLRSLGHSSFQSKAPTTLLYGMDTYRMQAFHNALNSIHYVGGASPMATTIEAAGADLAKLTGNSALIIVSDGLHMDTAPAAAQRVKSMMGDKLCIYTITVGNIMKSGKTTMSKIAAAGACGFAVSAHELNTEASMSAFIHKVFVSEVKDSDQDGVLNTMDQCPNTPQGVTVDVKGCPLDADQDGVPDYLDKCPNTPANVKVDAAGCPMDTDKDGVADYLDQCPATPAGVVVNRVGCPLDSDADGVPDYLDKCPDTPQGAPVDSNGCPLDSDKDGVADYLDQCPATPSGVSIDSDGCPTRLTLRIKFDNNSSLVAPEYHAELATAAQCINDYPGNEVLIYGHTDSKGAAEYNQKLSEKRASAVRNSLISQFAIAEKKLKIRGFGEDLPVADNETSEGRALNRRVEVLCGAAK